MPDLTQSLQNQDIGHLRIVAELWGLNVPSPATEAALKEISAALLNPELILEIIDALPPQAKIALEALSRSGGRLPWAAFSRQFGDLRLAGPGRRDREQVFLHPSSAAETLFYRALLARAFFDTPNGPQEFAYIPDDLLKFIRLAKKTGADEPKELHGKSIQPILSVALKASDPLGRPASPKERGHILPVSDRLLDDATTLLAALRMNILPLETSVPLDVVSGLLHTAGILAGNDPRAEKVKSFLEMPRPQALTVLAEAWVDSEVFNELRQVPGLICEGEWSNQPLVTREFLLSLLDVIPEDKWWSLTAFIRAIKERFPDFQRPAGDYDSWFIKCAADGTYLRGFSTWEEVDGALIRYLITGPLTWLGLVELATPEENEIITAFRVKSNLTRNTSPETGKLTVTSAGKISVPCCMLRSARYQIARFCEWDETQPDEYRYHVTSASLKRAVEHGLKISQLLSLLAKNAKAEIPPAFVKALKRWELNGIEARVEVQTVLKVSKPDVLEELRKSKAGRFLGESLGPVTVVVKPGAQSRVLAALAEIGLLAESVNEG